MIVIVGAGPCGLFVASRLHDLGHDVLVLSSSQKLFSFKNPKLKNWIESPGLGGRAKHWGGWLDFPTKQSFEEENWPVSFGNLKKQEKKVRKWLQAEKQYTSKQLIQEGYRPKDQANRKWQRWPFKIRKNIHVVELIEEKNKIIGLRCWDEKKKKQVQIQAQEVILSCSPFSTISLLKKLKNRSSELEKSMTNHMVAGKIAIFPQSKIQSKPSFCYKQVEKGIIELQGPLPAKKLNPSWGKYEYYKLHYIAELNSKNLKVSNFQITGDIIFNSKEKVLAKKMERQLDQEIKNLKLKDAINVKIQKTLSMTNIAHESGGAVFGKVVDQKGKVKKYQNLRVMDASLMPTGLKTYPTLTLLCLLNYLIAKKS